MPPSNQDFPTCNHSFLKEAVLLAKMGKCSSIFFFQDTFTTWISPNELLEEEGLKWIIVTQRAQEASQQGFYHTLPIRLFANGRMTQLRSAILLGLLHRYIEDNDRIACLGGLPNSDQLDTFLWLEVKREMAPIFSQVSDLLPAHVLPEVFERILSLATELAIEGREGKPVGCLFILGDQQKISSFVQPLVLNPFFGYSANERNILQPSLDETIKEYALLDGAFIVNGNGVIESAGSLVKINEHIALPGGLGTRHAAAIAISKAIDCLAITVSSSTRQVTLFRNGQMFPILTKGIGCSNAEQL